MSRVILYDKMATPAARGTAAAAASPTQQFFFECAAVRDFPSSRTATNDASLPTRVFAAQSDSSSPSAAASSASASLLCPSPAAAGSSRFPSSPTRAFSSFSSPTSAATSSPLRPLAATSFALPRSSLLVGQPCLLVRQGVPAANEEKIEKLDLPASKKYWPIAAKQFREELAALRRVTSAQLLQQHVARHKRLQQNVYGVEIEEDEERQKEEEKAREAGRESSTQEYADAGDIEWTAEEVRLLWQGKTVTRKKRKSAKIGEFDQESPSNLLQQKLLYQLPEGLQRGSERALWWRRDETSAKYAEASAGITTLAVGEERRGIRAPAAAEQEEEEEAEEELPVFGTRSIHKKKQLLTRVRPVWLPEPGPLHCDTGLPRSLVEASAAVAPPTSDEVRRLTFYPEEVKRRELEDRVVFETAGELLRQRFWRLWERHARQQHQQHGEQNRTRRRSRRKWREEWEGSSSSEGSSENGARKRTGSSLFLAEEEESQIEAEDGLEEHSDQEMRNCIEGVYSGRRRPCDAADLQATEDEMQNAVAIRATSRRRPRPPPWLLPHKGNSQPGRPFRHYRRAAPMDAAAATRAEEEEEWEAHTGGRAGACGTIAETVFPPGCGRYNSRRSKFSSPGGALDEELVVVGGPKKGWTWTIEDRHRWKRSRLLRRAMKNNQLLFAADLEERQYAADFERFTGRRFIPPRADWGGYAYYAAAEDEEEEDTLGEEEEQEGKEYCTRRQRGGDDINRRRGRRGSDDAAEIRESAWREAFETYVQEQRRREQEEQKAIQIGKQLGKAKRHEETRLVKLCEVLEGNLPSVFEDVPFPARKKHPKKRTVPFSRLRQYGEMIENITNCPFLQVDMQQALSEGWRYTRAHAAEVKHVPVPVGIPPDKYSVTKEKLQKASEKLHVPMAEEDAAALAVVRPQRVERVQEPEKLLGGGRYAV